VGSKLIKELHDRGLIAHITDKNALIKLLDKGNIALYCGFDPTADSLHLGHLVPLLCLKRFQLAGHIPIVLVGGATGLIGDPSFKAKERKLNSPSIVHNWVENIKKQVYVILSTNSIIVKNNYNWFSSMNVLNFLRNIGKYFYVKKMINKETVKQRIHRNESGISYTEFSYSLLQGYDFVYLNKHYNVVLQIGGSDQWGNIITGIDLTRRIQNNTVYGLTLPLLTKSDGNKFGKIEGGTTIWLDPKKTSPYKFYQFWIKTADSDVYNFLKWFTFIDVAEIDALEAEDRAMGIIQRSQHILATEVTRIVHGEQGLLTAKRITNNLFQNIISNLTEDDFIQLSKDGIHTISLERGADLQHALVKSELVPSRGQARNAISAKSVSVNNKKQNKAEYVFKKNDILYDRYTLLCSGKKNFCLIIWK